MNILDYWVVYDETRKIRPRFAPLDDSGWVPHGRYVVLREDGRPHMEISYCQGTVHGPYIDFWSNGTVACEGQYQDGKQEGVWHFYKKDGNLHTIIQFKQGKVIEDSLYIYDENGSLCEIVQSSLFRKPQ